MICKPVSDRRRCSANVIKLTAGSIGVLPVLFDLYPNAGYVFAYSDVVKVAQSIYCTMQALPLVLTLYYVGYYSERALCRLLGNVFFARGAQMKNIKLQTPLDMGAISWCATVAKYKEYYKVCPDICCLRYEDLLASPLPVMERVMKHLKLPDQLANGINVALKGDSNSKLYSVFSGTKSIKPPRLIRNREQSLNQILDTFNLPKLGEDNSLPGIINVN